MRLFALKRYYAIESTRGVQPCYSGGQYTLRLPVSYSFMAISGTGSRYKGCCIGSIATILLEQLDVQNKRSPTDRQNFPLRTLVVIGHKQPVVLGGDRVRGRMCGSSVPFGESAPGRATRRSIGRHQESRHPRPVRQRNSRYDMKEVHNNE